MSQPVRSITDAEPEEIAESSPRYGEHVIASGAILRAIEKQYGHPVHPEALDDQPTRDRILVVRERPRDRVANGMIIVPTEYQEEHSQGWILAVGHGCGRYLAPLFGTCDPMDYLGRKISWGRHTGNTMFVKDTDSDFKGEYVMIREVDVLSRKVHGDAQEVL